MEKDFDLQAFLSSPTCSSYLADASVKVLAEWFLDDREGQNLQPGTLDFYRCRLDYLAETFGDRKADEISTAHLRALLAHLKETRKWSVQNANHCIQIWKCFFNYLEDEEAIEKNPARRLKKLRQEKHFPKPYSSEEITALLKATSTRFSGLRDRTMILVLLDTGIRIAELMGLSVEDVDLAQGIMRVFGKGRKERFVPFEATVRRALMKYMGVRSVLLKKTGAREEAMWLTEMATPMAEDAMQFQLRALGARAGVQKVHAHNQTAKVLAKVAADSLHLPILRDDRLQFRDSTHAAFELGLYSSCHAHQYRIPEADIETNGHRFNTLGKQAVCHGGVQYRRNDSSLHHSRVTLILLAHGAFGCYGAILVFREHKSQAVLIFGTAGKTSCVNRL